MPFSVSGGTYTLSDTIANATSADATELQAILDDIQTAFNLTFLRDGSAVATGQFLQVVSATAGYSFSGDTDTGIGSDTGNEVWMMGGGVKTWKVNATGGVLTGTLSVSGLVTLTGGITGNVTANGTTAGFNAFEGITTDAGASGPTMSLYHNSATPAASDVIASYEFNGKDSGGNKTLYARMIAQITDPTDATEDANVFLQMMVAGVLTNMLQAQAAGIAIPGALAVTGAITGPGITASAALTGATAAGAMLATQAEQETGSATDKLVTPGRQHFHQSAAKAWGYTTYSGGTPTLQTPSYNMTSITDDGVGLLTWTIATDFSSGNWSFAGDLIGAGSAALVKWASIAAGSIQQRVADHDEVGNVDPSALSFMAFGDHA